MKLMDWEETLYRWEEYSEKLYPLRDEVAHIFETKCFYDDNWEYQERLYEADDDTVFLLKLSEMLNEICEFVKSHIEILSHRVEVDEEIRDNVQHAFEAWKRGLCPLLMRKVPHYVLSDKSGFEGFWETYDEVAKCLHGERMSYSATKRAIEEFEATRKKLKLSA